MTFLNNLIRVILLLLLPSIFSGCQTLKNLDILSSNQRGVYHTVQKGQTLYYIARTYDIDVNRLKRINGIYDPKALQIGTRLWIPGARQVLEINSNKSKQVLAKKKGRGDKKSKKKNILHKHVKVVKGFFREGDQLIVNYGDPQQGCPGIRMQTFCEDSFEFKVLVDAFATYDYVELPKSPELRIVPGFVTNWKAQIPTLRRTDETFGLQIKAEDRWGNPTDPGNAPFKSLFEQTD